MIISRGLHDYIVHVFNAFWNEAEHAEQILRHGDADLIALACEFLLNPNWPVYAAQALDCGDALDLLPSGYSWWLKRR